MADFIDFALNHDKGDPKAVAAFRIRKMFDVDSDIVASVLMGPRVTTWAGSGPTWSVGPLKFIIAQKPYTLLWLKYFKSLMKNRLIKQREDGSVSFALPVNPNGPPNGDLLKELQIIFDNVKYIEEEDLALLKTVLIE